MRQLVAASLFAGILVVALSLGARGDQKEASSPGLVELERRVSVLEREVQGLKQQVETLAPAPAGRPSAKIDVARNNIAALQTALEVFEVDVGRYPTAAEGLQALVAQPPGAQQWHGPYLSKLPKDPWGNPYLYRFPGKHNQNGFDLYSLGPDGKEGGGDDITNW